MCWQDVMKKIWIKIRRRRIIGCYELVFWNFLLTEVGGKNGEEAVKAREGEVNFRLKRINKILTKFESLLGQKWWIKIDMLCHSRNVSHISP